MGEAIQAKADTTNLYKLNNGYPEQPDLTLRLSLGGACSQNLKANPLIRSSCVAGVIPRKIGKEEFSGELNRGLSLSLARASSLPTETEQKSVIKLKEWQSIRRMAVKKRLVEQRRGGAAPNVETSSHGFHSGCQTAEEGEERFLSSPEKKSSKTECSPKQRIQFYGDSAENLSEARANTLTRNPWKKPKKNGEVPDDITGMKVMKTMPSVMATGEGPNGRKVEGFLYSYTRGEVSIVCICHGSFLSPEEFVKHAGCGNVVNPMKHIRVCSVASSF